MINLIQTEIIPAMAKRVIGQDNLTDADLTTILAADIPPVIRAAVASLPRIGFR